MSDELYREDEVRKWKDLGHIKVGLLHDGGAVVVPQDGFGTPERFSKEQIDRTIGAITGEA